MSWIVLVRRRNHPTVRTAHPTPNRVAPTADRARDSRPAPARSPAPCPTRPASRSPALSHRSASAPDNEVQPRPWTAPNDRRGRHPAARHQTGEQQSHGNHHHTADALPDGFVTDERIRQTQHNDDRGHEHHGEPGDEQQCRPATATVSCASPGAHRPESRRRPTRRGSPDSQAPAEYSTVSQMKPRRRDGEQTRPTAAARR